MPLFTFPPSPLILATGELDGSTPNSAVAANNAYFVGVYLYAPAVLTAIRIVFNPGGTGHYDVGIYTDNGSGQPGTLLANAASSATALATSTGLLTPSLIGGNVSLPPGRYWLALWVSNTTDKANSYLGGTTGIDCMMTGANGTNPLPPNAQSLTLSNTRYKPALVGLLQGSWS